MRAGERGRRGDKKPREERGGVGSATVGCALPCLLNVECERFSVSLLITLESRWTTRRMRTEGGVDGRGERGTKEKKKRKRNKEEREREGERQSKTRQTENESVYLQHPPFSGPAAPPWFPPTLTPPDP